MKTVKSTLEHVNLILSSSPLLEGLTVLHEFPGIRKDIPLVTATISVGLDSASLTAPKSQPFNSGALLTIINLRVSICIPKSFGGASCLETFEKVISSIRASSTISVISVHCENIEYSRNLGGFLLPAVITISDSMYE